MLPACSWSRLLLSLVLVVLPACATKNATDPMEVVWNKVEEPHQICQKLSGQPEFFRILGCSKWSQSARTCTIYAAPPRDEHDVQRMATLGHELMHCMDGNWHDRYGHVNEKYRQAAAGGTANRDEQDRKEELRKTCAELTDRPDFRKTLGCPDSRAAAGSTRAPKWDRKEELRKACAELSGRPDFRRTLGCQN